MDIWLREEQLEKRMYEYVEVNGQLHADDDTQQNSKRKCLQSFFLLTMIMIILPTRSRKVDSPCSYYFDVCLSLLFPIPFTIPRTMIATYFTPSTSISIYIFVTYGCDPLMVGQLILRVS